MALWILKQYAASFETVNDLVCICVGPSSIYSITWNHQRRTEVNHVYLYILLNGVTTTVPLKLVSWITISFLLKFSRPSRCLLSVICLYLKNSHRMHEIHFLIPLSTPHLQIICDRWCYLFILCKKKQKRDNLSGTLNYSMSAELGS